MHVLARLAKTLAKKEIMTSDCFTEIDVPYYSLERPASLFRGLLLRARPNLGRIAVTGMGVSHDQVIFAAIRRAQVIVKKKRLHPLYLLIET